MKTEKSNPTHNIHLIHFRRSTLQTTGDKKSPAQDQNPTLCYMKTKNVMLRLPEATYTALERQARAEQDHVSQHARKWLNILAPLEPQEALRVREMLRATFPHRYAHSGVESP
jgi:hypothetical protein